MMTDTQKVLIRDSWGVVKERCDNSNAEIGRAIFLRLFEEDPASHQLFPFKDETVEELKTSKKLGRHGANFVRNVQYAIEGMDKIFTVAGPKLVALGSRHYTYGVVDAHYKVAGNSLLHVLGEVLGDEFTDEVKDAWTALYSIISEAMREGGNDH